LLAQAAQALRAAQEVYTRAEQPQLFAQTQCNLGTALADEGDISGSSNAIEAALEALPRDVNVLDWATHIYHEKLFRFDRALELDEQKLKIDQSAVETLDLVEDNLTAAHFEACRTQAELLDDAALSAPQLPIRDALKLACQWGAGQRAAAQVTGNALSLKSAQLQEGAWILTRTLHYLATSPTFEPGRASWVALFQSLEKGDGPAMAAALQELEEVMKH
jgi:tetratricopeptide (TPR) repeat protein